MAGPCMEALLAWRTLDDSTPALRVVISSYTSRCQAPVHPKPPHKDQAPNQTSTMASQSLDAAGEALGVVPNALQPLAPPEWQACSHRLPQPPPAAPHAAALCLGDKCPPALSLQFHLLLSRLACAAVLAAGARCGRGRHGGHCPRLSVRELDVAQFAPAHHQHWLGLPGGGPAVHDRRRMLVPAAACAPAHLPAVLLAALLSARAGTAGGTALAHQVWWNDCSPPDGSTTLLLAAAPALAGRW